VRRPRAFLALFAVIGVCCRASAAGLTAERLVANLRSAYAGVQDYQMRVASTVKERGRPAKETRLRYRFKRPDRFRIEFLEPHRGLVLAYPTGSGKVRIRPGGLFRFLSITLDPGSASLEVSPGQRIDQADLGLLVRNIARSLNGPLAGAPALRVTPEHVVAVVEAENHFQPGVRTRYEFWIERRRWLPVRVREAVPERGWEREVTFEELETNQGLPDALFLLE
jgi:outer membrane lipoprotein-sorting protein